jgi:hypothetical protein
MKLYRIKFFHSQQGEKQQWLGTKAEATVTHNRLRDQHGRHDVSSIEQVNVPTDKDGLLDFLNQMTGPAPEQQGDEQ